MLHRATTSTLGYARGALTRPGLGLDAGQHSPLLLCCWSSTGNRLQLKANLGRRLLHYEQGQAGPKYKREYFYMIDHQGMLFLDDARMKNFTSCFKEHKFLHFFFSRVRLNNTGFYQDEFPYVSPCGIEMNYIRCDDVPIVFTHLLADRDILLHNHAGERLQVPFQPETLCMVSRNGRVYHRGPQRQGGVGLVASKLAIKLSQNFEFVDGQDTPVAYIYKGERFELNSETEKILNTIPHYEGDEG